MSGEEMVLTLAAAGLGGLGLQRLRLPVGLAAALPAGAALAFVLMRASGLTVPQAAASAIFLFCYALIASDKIHKTNVALGGAAMMMFAGLIDQHTALHGAEDVAGVDWNTILLLIGMMVIVNITRHTGVFEWVAVYCAKVARGSPMLITTYLALATALLSSLLDNVTTVLLMAPVGLEVCRHMKLNPVPLLMATIVSSNLGGTATLIGHPPNIMIGSSARFSFMDFLNVDSPIVLMIMAAFLGTLWVTAGRRLRVTAEQREAAAALDASGLITSPGLLRLCLAVIAFALVGFGVHGALGLEPATIALAAAAVLLVLRRRSPEAALRDVEWTTIFFFIGLFVMVSALVKVGVVRLLAQGILHMTCGPDVAGPLSTGQRFLLTMGILWFSAIAAGIMDNIPFVATMIPVLHDMAATLHPAPQSAGVHEVAHAPDVLPLWWALSLGACLGANFTLIGASTNIIVAGIAERANHPISFGRYLRYGLPLTLQSLVLASIYLWLRFLR